MRKKQFALAAAALAAGSSGVLAQPAMPAPAAVSPNRLFVQQCASCHSTVAGETRVGPSLAGIAGRRAGSLADYPYSDALRQKGAGGLAWNAQSLDSWLADSGTFIPGSVMNFRQADPAKRAAIISYLSELK